MLLCYIFTFLYHYHLHLVHLAVERRPIQRIQKQVSTDRHQELKLSWDLHHPF